MGGIYSEKGRNDSERSEQKGIETWMYIYRENTVLITYIIHISYTSKTFFFFALYIFSSRRKIKNCTNAPSKGKQRIRKKWHPT